MRKALAAIAAVTLLGSACSSGGSSNGGAPGGAVKEGGTVRIGTTSNIDSLNPFVAFQQNAYATFEYVYPTLVQYDTRTLKFIPDFATKWEQSADGKTWTFHTVANAKWSDGQPLTANDAAWTFNTIIKYGNGPTANFSGDFAHVDSITASDPNTLVITYKEPVANVLSNLQQVFVLPQHVWEKYATGDGKQLRTYSNQPAAAGLVSGGPFQLVEYKKDDIALFKKNPAFYGPKPHIDGFGLQYFSNDDAEITAIEHNQIDAIEGPVPPTSIDAVKKAGIHVSIGPGVELRDFIINSHKPIHPELLNPTVRQAFEYGIDRNRIVQTAWLGYASPGSTIVPPGTGKWHDADIQPLPFDPAKGNQLLDSLGFKKGPDGIRIADGHPMSYQVVFPNDEKGPGDRAFQIIQDGFQQMGVKLTQRTMDNSAAFDAICGKDCTAYDTFDLAMWDWVPLEDPDFILSVLTCNQFGGWSDTGYCNKEYDRLYQEQGVATNEQDRLRIVYQMQKIAYDARPYIVYSYDKEIDAWNDQFTGYVESNQGLFQPLSKQSMTEVHLAG